MLDRASRVIRELAKGKSAGELIARADDRRDARAWGEAAELYRAALDIDNGLPQIWVQYGHALKESGRLKDAEAAYLRALTIADSADTHLQLGHLLKIMGRRREAEEKYLHAFERQPELADARSELIRMGWTGARLRKHLVKEGAAPHGAAAQASIVFELSDLIDHLRRTRYPTGIQRVQLALGEALARTSDEDRVQFAYYDAAKCSFFEVQRRQVLDVVDFVDNIGRGDRVESDMVDRLKTDIVEAREFEFPHGSYLVNVGTSWGHINYFMSIRELKRRSQVRYVPLVHDIIPLIYPEFCNPNLVRDFINWITNMIGHADLVLTNSDHTKADVVKVAEQLEAKLPPATTVRLNGEFGNLATGLGLAEEASLGVLCAHNLDVEDFVLFVSTIEPRKNHMLALNAWSKMLKTRQWTSVPRLVCVGGSGWMNEPFYQRLERDEALRERVVVMTDVSDQVLQLLYGRCMFALFPSLYEGWGLPISEALAYGKIPLVSKVSSHPEAGGDLAVYFNLDSELDFQTKLESLIDDVDMRRAHEERIRAAQPLRPWSDIAKDIFDVVDGHFAEVPPESTRAAAAGSPAITCGRYYSLARNLAPSLQMIAHSGEIYRKGKGWHAPEPWGCWVRGLSGELGFDLAQEEGDDFLVYLHWVGSQNLDNTVTLSLPPSTWSKRFAVSPEQERWDVIPVHFGPDSRREVRLRIAAEGSVDFGELTGGRDPRVTSVGIMGLYVSRASDCLQRTAIIEAIQFRDLDPVARRFYKSALL